MAVKDGKEGTVDLKIILKLLHANDLFPNMSIFVHSVMNKGSTYSVNQPRPETISLEHLAEQYAPKNIS